MKRHMILLPVLLQFFDCQRRSVFAQAVLHLHTGKSKRRYAAGGRAGIYNDSCGCFHALELSGKGKDISYTTSFLKEQEELVMEYDSLNEGFYLYIPTLLDGKQLTDYELEISRTITDDRYEEPVKADFYNIKQVAVDLLVKTDKGLCLLSKQ